MVSTMSINVALELLSVLFSRALDLTMSYQGGAILIFDMELHLRVLATEAA